MINKLLGPKGIILFCVVIVTIWFRQGLLFAGAEEQLSFYNYTKSLDLFSYSWLAVGTGMPTLLSLPRIPYFSVFETLYRIGFSAVFLQALTFFIIILSGILSVYYLIKETLADVIKEQWKTLVPFLGALFYFLNPFAMTQIWGRALSYQSFVFALVPSFLLFFILSLKRRNLIYCVLAVLSSLIFSSAYLSPASVISSWSAVGIYLLFYIYISRNNFRNVLFALSSFLLLIFLWVITNSFWIYPILKYGNELITGTLSSIDNVGSLKGLSPNSRIYNVIRLIHREYYDGTYGSFYSSFLVILISWLLPVFGIFSLSVFKKGAHFLFYLILFIVGIFVTIGANFPTGILFIWLFEHLPLLAILRNPYEKFGINLSLAYAPFFALGIMVLSEKLSAKKVWLRNTYLLIFVFLQFVLLVFPFWKGNFAGGVKTSFWVKVPDYYLKANNWLSSQKEDFNILHLPLLPEDGVTYTWEHPYEGIEASEFLFDKTSIARNYDFNKDYYSALIERFGIAQPTANLPLWSNNNLDFKDESLIKELAKLNVRFIILHHDINYKFRRALSPEDSARYIESINGISKVNTFGQLDIYKVNIPNDIGLIYSPDIIVSYRKINTTSYLVDVKGAKTKVNLYFLQQFHPSWKASISGKEVENHSEMFSYANKWTIDKIGDYQVEIRFVQQDAATLGSKIAHLSFGLVVIILLLPLFKIRKFFH